MENYIVINGKKAELTEEQLEQLGIEIKKPNPYERQCNIGVCYYYEDRFGNLTQTRDDGTDFDKKLFDNASYCTDNEIAEQDRLHDLLNRKLRQFSNLNGGIELNSDIKQGELPEYAYCIYYFRNDSEFKITGHINTKFHGIIYFISPEIAERAIEEIIKPFMKEHPDFVW